MRPSIQCTGFAAGVTLMALAAAGTVKANETWRGLSIAPEHRCAPYDRDDYPYSQSVETRIIAGMGGRVKHQLRCVTLCGHEAVLLL